jgi:RNA polymerase sigma-70 factor (ECF subfamily)
VIWQKFDQYDPDTTFMKWACVIARFEDLAYWRKMACDRLVFREDVSEEDLRHPIYPEKTRSKRR